MAKNKYTSCPKCGERKIMTDEQRRGYNATDTGGKRVCPDCKVREIYERFGL